MALTNEQIKEAVLALDVNNDANWKADGMPKVPVLKQAIGAGSGELSQALVLGSFGLSTQAPYDIRNMILENAAQESTPEKQDDAPAETPAENGDGESTADADKYAEKTRADADSYSQTTRADADKYYQERKEQADKEYKTTMQNAQRDADALRKKAPPADNGGGDTASDTPTATSGDRVLVRIIEGARVHTGEADAPTAVGKEYVLVIPSTAETLIESNLAQEVREPRPDELALAINAPAETA